MKSLKEYYRERLSNLLKEVDESGLGTVDTATKRAKDEASDATEKAKQAENKAKAREEAPTWDENIPRPAYPTASFMRRQPEYAYAEPPVEPPEPSKRSLFSGGLRPVPLTRGGKTETGLVGDIDPLTPEQQENQDKAIATLLSSPQAIRNAKKGWIDGIGNIIKP